jgi:hypothetical protein
MVLSMPILLILGGVLLFFMRSEGLKLGPTLVAVLLGAQISGTVLATGVDAALSAAGHLLGTVFA